MTNTRELRDLRHWLNEARWSLLDGFIAINYAVKRNEASAKRQLVVRLRALNEFGNSTAHEEYRAG
ncbi:hypothetical protein [Streptomyces chartreusis]|uniref:Uncharacterized protein n=1 Tax=Streptomyces chartreusis TaxID=1969 RepID=A0A7H8THS9_STRCX|nr:hypothetical protein [Streptomyces chartreusis]QKZ22857.1 hypothetical protein HUT05_39230 [Streptomyces chartreusis]